jgi:pimeloyl-ACP methyl ester carboxylesterase
MAWLVLVAVVSFAQASGWPVSFRECELAGVPGKARCGTIAVPEAPNDPKSRQIDLNLVVLPSSAGGPGRQALFFLDGGPGEAAAEKADGFAGIALRASHDIVLLDQRGTGRSNNLGCRASIEKLGAAVLLGELFPDELIRDCAAALPADPRFYTTAEFVQDIEAVRQSLGYARIDLYGLSYGTRAAQEYAKTFPESVRSVLLEGVLAPEWVIPLPFAAGSQNALDRLLDDCARDRDCSSAFPRLREEFERLLKDLNQAPRTVIARESTGRPVDFTLTKDLLATTVRSLLYNTADQAEIPLLIHQAAEGDTSGLAQKAWRVRQAHGRGLGLYLSVVCAEDLPRADQPSAEMMSAGTFLGSYWYRRLKAACRLWNASPRSLRTDRRVNAPALLVSGALDPTTPPASARSAAGAFDDVLVLYLPEHSHMFTDYGCADRLANQFFTAGTHRGMDVSCTRQVRRPAFTLRPERSQ